MTDNLEPKSDSDIPQGADAAVSDAAVSDAAVSDATNSDVIESDLVETHAGLNGEPTDAEQSDRLVPTGDADVTDSMASDSLHLTPPDAAAATSTRRWSRWSTRRKVTAAATAMSIVLGGSVAGWAVYNRPELRLVRAIQGTTQQKDFDVNLSMQMTPAFVTRLNHGKTDFAGTLPSIRTASDAAKALSQIRMHIASSGKDLKYPAVQVGIKYGEHDVLALTVLNRKFYLQTQAKTLASETPQLFTQQQFDQILAQVKMPLSPENAAFITDAQRSLFTKALDLINGQALYVSFAPGTKLGSWWDKNVTDPKSTKSPDIQQLQKKLTAFLASVRKQLRTVATVQDLSDDAAGDRMRVTLDIATLLKSNRQALLDIASAAAEVGSTKVDNSTQGKELDAAIKQLPVKKLSFDAWVKDNHFSRMEFDITALMDGGTKLSPRSAVMRMDVSDAPVTAPTPAVEFTNKDINSIGDLVGGLFMGALSGFAGNNASDGL